MDPRAINFNVLRRHDSQITSIIDSTSYVVIYRYFHGAWSKTGLEGTMFIFQRETPPLYGVFVLNRQGLDNMSQGLLAGWEVDLDEGLIIWRNEGATGDADDDVIHGLWIYEEKDRSRIAGVMQSLIDLSSPQSEPEPAATIPPPVSLSHPVPRVPIIAAGQSISLDQLFGVGSVCSEPPPQTSALPHPGTSVIDPEEEDPNSNTLPPQHVMSPDPSDLPKGMQLLDSLFQKAGMKSQPSNQSLANVHTPEQQPLNIHQLLQQQEQSQEQQHQQLPVTQRPPLQTSTSSSQHPHTRDHRRGSSDENYQPQSSTYTDGVPHTHHPHITRGHHHRTSNANSAQQSSRRSSGGSSSHARSEKIVGPVQNLPSGPQSQHYHQPPPPQSTQAVMVPPPIPIDSAEARHNILSLLGHPAAVASNVHHHNPTWIAPNGGSPDSGREVYHPSTYPTRPHPDYHQHHPGTSQHPSPQQKTGQDGSPHLQGYIHHTPPDQSSPISNGGTYHHQLHHGPNKIRATPPKPPLPTVPVRGVQPTSQYGAWNNSEPFPKRALSPLNPASRTHYPTHPNYRKLNKPSTHSPPIVNDSSRPTRVTHTLKKSGSSSSSVGGGGTMVIQNKLAAEVLDEVLGDHQKIDGLGLGRNEDDQEALDKKEFVVGILELIKSNGAFVDSLYARYLARYAERYL